MDHKSIALLLLRLAFGFRLIYGVIDNIVSWERMLEFKIFLTKMGFPFPLICAIASVYIQMLAGLSWLIGYKIKLMSLLMIGNFIVAIVGVHVLHKDSYLNTAPAIHLLVVAIVLYLLGGGRYGLDKSSV